MASAWAIFSVKNYDENTINITFLNEIPSDTTTYQCIDTVMNQDEIVKYLTEFLNLLVFSGMPLDVLT